MMTRNLFSLAAAGLLSAALAAPALAQIAGKGGYGNKGGNNKEKKEEEKPDPIVIRFQGAQKGKHMGQEVMMVSGVEVLSGRPRTFAVENEKPQDKNKMPKYEPRPQVKEGVEKVKPGEYLRVELKGHREQVPWIEKAEPYIAQPGEDEPGTFIMFQAFEEEKNGTKMYAIVLRKFGGQIDCFAPMVKEGKDLVPDPEIVKVASAIKERSLVEATVGQSKGQRVVTSLDPYQAPKQGKFTKLVESDVDGNKGQAVELDHDGKPVTLPIPGKSVNGKWVTDNDLLADARKLKPGAAVVFKTRDVGDKSYVRLLAPAPKESAKKEPKSAGGGDGPMPKSKDKEPAKK